MNKSDKNIEDFLTQEELNSENPVQGQFNSIEPSKRKLIIAIIDFFHNSNLSSLSEFEKLHLKKEIKSDIISWKIKNYLKRLSVAAMFLILLGFSVFFIYQNNELRNLSKFAQQTGDIIPFDNVSVVFKDGTKLHFENNSSEIQYSEQDGRAFFKTGTSEYHKVLNNGSKELITVIVPFGETTSISLADGSKVWLNAGSKLILPIGFSKNRRGVYLEGEAVFDVANDESKPFYVLTNEIDIKVIGTIFNVSAYKSESNVNTTLVEGSIELSYNSDRKILKQRHTIEPGIKAILDKTTNTFYQKQVNALDVISWRNGFLKFNKEKLPDILNKIARYYNLEIEISKHNFNEESFSGQLMLKENPEDVLRLIAEMTSFKFEIKKDTIIIN